MIDYSKISEKDDKLINVIANRAMRLNGIGEYDLMTCQMDLCAAHADVGLDLKKLFQANDFDFMHDIAGIANNMNRDTCELENCFLPRCALSDNSTAQH